MAKLDPSEQGTFVEVYTDVKSRFTRGITTISFLCTPVGVECSHVLGMTLLIRNELMQMEDGELDTPCLEGKCSVTKLDPSEQGTIVQVCTDVNSRFYMRNHHQRFLVYSGTIGVESLSFHVLVHQ